jgi:hypothetical protein
MTPLRIRCSALGQIMASPTAAAVKAGEVLSVGAKTYIRKLAREDIFGVQEFVSTKAMEKGTRCEDEGILLYNAVFGTSHVKNTERRTDDYLTGECDIAGDPVIDIKLPWSVSSFPICELDAANSDYEWQGRGYMRLWDAPSFRVAYCLVDTPDDLLGYERPELHRVSHVDDRLRVTVWDFARDLEKEALIVEKVKAAREYYSQVIADFDRSHK